MFCNVGLIGSVLLNCLDRRWWRRVNSECFVLKLLFFSLCSDSCAAKGKRIWRRMNICIIESRCCTPKLTQHCKSTLPRWKKKEKSLKFRRILKNVGKCLGMSFLKGIFLLFPLLDRRMDRSKDHNGLTDSPLQWFGSQANVYLTVAQAYGRVAPWTRWVTPGRLGCFSKFNVLVLSLHNLLCGRKTVHLVILETLRKISLPPFITYLPSHLCAHDREDKWI